MSEFDDRIKELRYRTCPNCSYSKVVWEKFSERSRVQECKCCHPDNIKVDCSGQIIFLRRPDMTGMNNDLNCPRFLVRPKRTILQSIKDWFISMWEG